jgi:predicted aconitase
MSLQLEAEDEARLKGLEGPALQFAMQLLVQAATIMGATRLVPIQFAHLDSCFYAGQAHVDFARRLVGWNAKLKIKTWTNSSVASHSHPQLRPENDEPEIISGARELMQLYMKLGASPTFTCAPYDRPDGPGFGDHIVVGESNAVSFYNSVLGCRTNKYGDYLDVACALLGKAPYAGLHSDEGRRATLHIDCDSISDVHRQGDLFPHLLGFIVGQKSGRRIPAISGLPLHMERDGLKAISSAAAASGGVELWHGVGVTPEAPNLENVFKTGESITLTAEDLKTAYRNLSSANDGPLDAIALGTPHFSVSEFARLREILQGRHIAKNLPFLVSTSRFVRDFISGKGWLAELEEAGLTIITDVCTYYSPRIPSLKGKVMTNAAKWAYYAPGMIGVEVILGSLEECVESAVRGEVWRGHTSWLRT